MGPRRRRRPQGLPAHPSRQRPPRLLGPTVQTRTSRPTALPCALRRTRAVSVGAGGRRGTVHPTQIGGHGRGTRGRRVAVSDPAAGRSGRSVPKGVSAPRRHRFTGRLYNLGVAAEHRHPGTIRRLREVDRCDVALLELSEGSRKFGVQRGQEAAAISDTCRLAARTTSEDGRRREGVARQVAHPVPEFRLLEGVEDGSWEARRRPCRRSTLSLAAPIAAGQASDRIVGPFRRGGSRPGRKDSFLNSPGRRWRASGGIPASILTVRSSGI